MKYSPKDLSKRQLQIISLLASGLSQSEIADQLYINRRSISKSLQRSRDALGLDNNLQLGALAVSSGVIQLQGDLQKYKVNT